MFKSFFPVLACFLFATPSSADVDDWHAAHDLEAVVVEDGMIRARSTGHDPYFLAEGIRVDPATVSEIAVRMRSSATGFAELFWATERNPAMAPARSLRLPVSRADQVLELRFRVAEHPQWSQSPVTRLRLDPINRADAEMVVESISLRAVASSVSTVPRPVRRHAPTDDGRPNIIFLLTDDQRWDSIGVNNPDLAISTPAIDRLANEGVNFVNGFVTTPICAVSRASIISGRHTRNHRVHYRAGLPV